MKTPSLALPLFLVCFFLGNFFPERGIAQTPDTRGAFTVATWDPGMVSLAGASIHVHVYYPMGATTPMPLLGVVHGASRTAANMAEMSNTFASRGFVVLAPDMPCNFLGCDHAANALQLRALLDWGVAQSADATTPLAGLVDGTRRGLAGHSWGALASFLAADGDPDIDAVVILDANDSMMDGDGHAAAPTFTQPVIHIMASVAGSCNSFGWSTEVVPLTPGPHLKLVVTGAAHCDVENPSDSLCPFACGSGDPALNNYFRRYAVAWMSCILQNDASMASWIMGSDLDADVSGSHIGGVTSALLSTLPCLGGTGFDGGIPPVDAGTPGGDSGTPATDMGTTTTDAGMPSADAGTPGVDAGTAMPDASHPGMDAGTTMPPASGGCCSVAPATHEGRSALLALLLLAPLLPRRRSWGHSPTP